MKLSEMTLEQLRAEQNRLTDKSTKVAELIRQKENAGKTCFRVTWHELSEGQEVVWATDEKDAIREVNAVNPYDGPDVRGGGRDNWEVEVMTEY